MGPRIEGSESTTRSAAKETLVAEGKSGTELYKYPTEERFTGKAGMVKFGYFDRTDVSITWQPWDVSTVTDSTMTVLFCAKLRFIGWLAHAGATPEIGRSALDAMELMTVGANYISGNTWWSRAGCTIVITNGGQVPSIVPAEAEVWYVGRSPSSDDLQSLWLCLNKVAEACHDDGN